MTGRRPTFSRRLALAAMGAILAAGGAVAQPAAPAGDFTIAVIPDTQNYVRYDRQVAGGFPFDAQKLFLDQMKYVADNARGHGGDIVFAVQVGDVWQHPSQLMDPAHAARGFKLVDSPLKAIKPTPKTVEIEMPNAKAGFDLIAGRMPFSVVPGNHDYDAVWTDINHPAEAVIRGADDIGVLHSGGLDNFNAIFGDQTPYFRGQDWYVASHDGGADNAQVFTAGGYRFLHIGLQFDPPDASLEWAASVIKRYPGLPTIVSTHNYLNGDGERVSDPHTDQHAVDPQDNTPQMLWDKFISRHDQIFMVLCGHQEGQSLRTDDNRSGHKVYQLLADYQSRTQTARDAGAAPGLFVGVGDGWLRLMTFSLQGASPSVHVHTYSTHYKAESRDHPDYARWYKAGEKPRLSDADFLAQDDFKLELTDFRARFGAPKAKP